MASASEKSPRGVGDLHAEHGQHEIEDLGFARQQAEEAEEPEEASPLTAGLKADI